MKIKYNGKWKHMDRMKMPKQLQEKFYFCKFCVGVFHIPKNTTEMQLINFIIFLYIFLLRKFNGNCAKRTC